MAHGRPTKSVLLSKMKLLLFAAVLVATASARQIKIGSVKDCGNRLIQLFLILSGYLQFNVKEPT